MRPLALKVHVTLSFSLDCSFTETVMAGVKRLTSSFSAQHQMVSVYC